MSAVLIPGSSIAEKIVRNAISDFSEELVARIKGRIDMNARTAEVHSDPSVRAEAAARVVAYELALSDLSYVTASFVAKLTRRLTEKTIDGSGRT